MSKYETTVTININEELIKVEVSYTITSWGNSGTPASLSYPGDPPEPPEYEIDSIVTMPNNTVYEDNTNLNFNDLSESAQETIDNAVYEALCEKELEPYDPDYDD